MLLFQSPDIIFLTVMVVMMVSRDVSPFVPRGAYRFSRPAYIHHHLDEGSFSVGSSSSALYDSSSSKGSRIIPRRDDEYDIDAAAVKLTWETLEASNSKPLLNLSARDVSPEQVTADQQDQAAQDRSEWDQGQRWSVTRDGLAALLEERYAEEAPSSVDLDIFLETCPQLLRLDPAMVLDSAQWVRDEFGAAYLLSEPRLLSFRPSHLAYGLEFLSTMMAIPDAKPVCASSPQLFLQSVEGGIQEQAVSSALSAASDATGQAMTKIAGDAISSIQQLQNRKNKPKGL